MLRMVGMRKIAEAMELNCYQPNQAVALATPSALRSARSAPGGRRERCAYRAEMRPKSSETASREPCKGHFGPPFPSRRTGSGFDF